MKHMFFEDSTASSWAVLLFFFLRKLGFHFTYKGLHCNSYKHTLGKRKITFWSTQGPPDRLRHRRKEPPLDDPPPPQRLEDEAVKAAA